MSWASTWPIPRAKLQDLGYGNITVVDHAELATSFSGSHERPVQHGADLRRQPATQHQHAVVVDPGGQMPGEVPGVGFLRRNYAVSATPRPYDSLNMRRRACERDIQQPLLGLRRGHPGDGPHLGVRDRAAGQSGADEGQSGQRTRHSDLLARGAEVDPGAPVQPVSAGEEPGARSCAQTDTATWPGVIGQKGQVHPFPSSYSRSMTSSS